MSLTLSTRVEPVLSGVPEYVPREKDVKVEITIDRPKLVRTIHTIQVMQSAGWMAYVYGAAVIRWHDGRVQRLELSEVTS